MRTCPYCGKEYADDTTVCAIDGEVLVAPVSSSPEELVDQAEKKWIEESFHWLLSEFGEDQFLKRKTIQPDASFFPDKYKGDEQSVLTLVKRVCSYMDVNPELVEVEFFSDRESIAREHRLGGEEEHAGAAGLYFSDTSNEPKKKMAINENLFRTPTALVATVAHELGHVILLGSGRVSRDHPSHEYLTDLLTVFFGLGIFTANSAFQFSQWHDYSHQGWRSSRAGYLSEEMFGYALAAYAWMRGETKPKWSQHLAMNVGHYFNQSLKNFHNGGSTSLRRLVRAQT